MRVAHIITRLIVGGAQENTVASALGLRRRGVAVQLISGPTAGPEGSLESSVTPPELLSIAPHLIRPVRPLHDLRALLELRRRLRIFRPDVVHTHSGKAGILGRLAARQLGVAVVVHTIHGPSFGPFQGPVENYFYRAAERRAGRWTDHFVAVASAMQRQYLAAGIGQPGQYTRIYSGFRLEPFLRAGESPEGRRRFGFAPGDIVLGMIARFFELKGHADLFAIAPALIQQCPALKFLLVGGGPWQERFQAQARAVAPGRVVFSGLLSPPEIPEAISAMDILAHLSRREGLARALPQALAARRPIIAYDLDGAEEVCWDGETGFLIPPGDRDRVQEKILQLARDPDLRFQMGRRGQAFVSENFAEQTMVENLLGLYQRLLEAKRAAPP